MTKTVTELKEAIRLLDPLERARMLNCNQSFHGNPPTKRFAIKNAKNALAILERSPDSKITKKELSLFGELQSKLSLVEQSAANKLKFSDLPTALRERFSFDDYENICSEKVVGVAKEVLEEQRRKVEELERFFYLVWV